MGTAERVLDLTLLMVPCNTLSPVYTPKIKAFVLGKLR